MTKVEFIAALRAKLSMLPDDAREDAVQFYEEYFDEAGPENEQAVIAELGSPDAVAEKILSGEGKVIPRGWQNGSSTHQQPSNNTTSQSKDKNTLPWVLLAIVTSPFWVVALIVLICVVITIVMMILAAVMVAVALALTCVISLGVAVWLIPHDLINGLMVLSVGLIGLGGIMIVVPLLMLLFKKGVPALKRGWKKLWARTKENAKKAWSKVKNIG